MFLSHLPDTLIFTFLSIPVHVSTELPRGIGLHLFSLEIIVQLIVSRIKLPPVLPATPDHIEHNQQLRTFWRFKHFAAIAFDALVALLLSPHRKGPHKLKVNCATTIVYYLLLPTTAKKLGTKQNELPVKARYIAYQLTIGRLHNTISQT